MSRTLAVAAREFADRRFVLWAALAAGVIPLVSPILPWVKPGDSATARQVMCLILATAFGPGSAVLLGAGAVARDLSEGRMGFDFSRPIGAGLIWAGRFLAALGIVVASVAVVVAPTELANRIYLQGAGSVPEFGLGIALLGALAAGLLLLPLSHAASVAFRSRSPWLAVDLVAVVVVALAATGLARRLVGEWAVELATVLGASVGGVTLLAFWLASAAQVAVGRTDLRRGHRVQSVTLWSVVFLALAVAGAIAGWALRAAPRDLASVAGAMPASTGDWVYVDGPAAARWGFYPAFFVNSRDGRFVRLGGTSPWAPSAVFSRDGRRAVWTHRTGDLPARLEVLTIDFDSPDPVPRPSPVVIDDGWFLPAVSPDARSVALCDGTTVSVHDVDSGAVRAALRLDRAPGSRVAPPSPAISRRPDSEGVRAGPAADGVRD